MNFPSDKINMPSRSLRLIDLLGRMRKHVDVVSWVWHHVEPGVKPADVDQATWDAGVAKTRATIGLLIDDNQHGLIRNSTTAREASLSLQNHHRKSTLTSKVSLLKRVCDKRFEEVSRDDRSSILNFHME